MIVIMIINLYKFDTSSCDDCCDAYDLSLSAYDGDGGGEVHRVLRPKQVLRPSTAGSQCPCAYQRVWLYVSHSNRTGT